MARRYRIRAAPRSRYRISILRSGRYRPWSTRFWPKAPEHGSTLQKNVANFSPGILTAFACKG